MALIGLRWSGQADPPDRERERAGLALGDHETDLADACRVERRGNRDLVAAEAGAELGEWDAQCLPAVRIRRECGLIVQAVEAVVGQQVELEALATAAGLDDAEPRASAPACCRRRANGGEATIAFERDVTLEHGVAGRIVAEAAFRDAAHHPVVDGRPCVDTRRIGEVEEQTRRFRGTHGVFLGRRSCRGRWQDR